MGHVYLAEFETVVKIGRSKTPHARIASIRYGSEKLQNQWISDAIPGDSCAENELHRKYRKQNVCGEFFRINFGKAIVCAREICRGIGQINSTSSEPTEKISIILSDKNAKQFESIDWKKIKKNYVANVALEQFFEREEKLPKEQRII